MWLFSAAYYASAIYILSFTVISHLLLYYFVKNFGKKVMLPIVNTLATTKWRAFGRDFANSKTLLSLVHLKAVETIVINVNAHKPIPISLTNTSFAEFERAVYSRYEFHADSYLDKLMKYTEKLDGVFRALEEFKVVSDEIGECNVPVSASSFLSLKTIVPARGGGGGTMVTRDNRDTFPTEIPFHRLSSVTTNVVSSADIGSAVIADGFAPGAASVNVNEEEGDDNDIDNDSDSMPSLVDIENDSSATDDENDEMHGSPRRPYYDHVIVKDGCKHKGLDAFYKKQIEDSNNNGRWLLGNELKEQGWDVERTTLTMIVQCPCLKEENERSKPIGAIGSTVAKY